MIAGPADLHLAIHKVEQIEMARNLASGGQAGQKTQNQYQGRGRFQRGRGHFNAVQIVNTGQQQKCSNATNLNHLQYSLA